MSYSVGITGIEGVAMLRRIFNPHPPRFHVSIPRLLQAVRRYEFGLLLVLFSFNVPTLSLIYRIVHYEQRLKSLFTKKRFPERMGEIKPRVQGMLCMF